MQILVDGKEINVAMQTFITNQLPKILEECLEDAGNIVEAEAKALCPVRDGQLIQSIRHEVDGNKVTIGSEVEYAPYVECGTGIFAKQGNGRTQVPWRYQDQKGDWHTTYGMVAQSYLEPAVTENISRIVQCFGGKI